MNDHDSDLPPLDRFSANRLTVARCRKGFSKRVLAEHLGVSAQTITFYEEGERVPERQRLAQLALILGYPLSFFSQPDVDFVAAESITFRARRSLKSSRRDIALAIGTIAVEIITPELERRFKLPPLDIPDLSSETPESAARQVRDQWRLGLGPIHNMAHLLESKGVKLFWMNQPDRCLDASSLWRAETPYVLLNSQKQAGDRARFDAAHELGHLVLHRNVDVENSEVESEADQFAAAFLMPRQSFIVETPRLPVLSDYYGLKQRWGCSIQAMVRRGKDLGVFSTWHYERSVRQMSMLGWRSGVSEPSPVAREQSMLHAMVFERLVEKGITPPAFAKLLHLPTSDVLELMPTAEKFMQTEKAASMTNATPALPENRLRIVRGSLRD